MKNIIKYVFILFAVFSNSLLSAQSPGKFNYQAVIRNSAGQPLANTSVGVRFQIYNQVAGGTIVYQEDFTPTTNAFGVVNLSVGTSPSVGDLKLLNWGSSSFFANIQMGTGGTYTDISSSRSQLVSVPYALYAAKADTANVATAVLGGGTPAGSIIAWGGTTAPAGWYICDGSAKSRTTDAALFGAISTNYGIGDGTSTFNIPDFRGQFLRGVTSTAGTDPDVNARTANGNGLKNAPGSTQGDGIKTHIHTYHGYHVVQSGGGPVTSCRSDSPISSDPVVPANDDVLGNETRPTNVYVNYIIKH